MRFLATCPPKSDSQAWTLPSQKLSVRYSHGLRSGTTLEQLAERASTDDEICSAVLAKVSNEAEVCATAKLEDPIYMVREAAIRSLAELCGEDEFRGFSPSRREASAQIPGR